MDYKSIREEICAKCDERFTCSKSHQEIDNCVHAMYPLEF